MGGYMQPLLCLMCSSSWIWLIGEVVLQSRCLTRQKLRAGRSGKGAPRSRHAETIVAAPETRTMMSLLCSKIKGWDVDRSASWGWQPDRSPQWAGTEKPGQILGWSCTSAIRVVKEAPGISYSELWVLRSWAQEIEKAKDSVLVSRINYYSVWPLACSVCKAAQPAARLALISAWFLGDEINLLGKWQLSVSFRLSSTPNFCVSW